MPCEKTLEFFRRCQEENVAKYAEHVFCTQCLHCGHLVSRHVATLKSEKKTGCFWNLWKYCGRR